MLGHCSSGLVSGADAIANGASGAPAISSRDRGHRRSPGLDRRGEAEAFVVLGDPADCADGLADGRLAGDGAISVAHAPTSRTGTSINSGFTSMAT